MTLTKETPGRMRRVWLILIIAPVLFLIVIIAASVYFGAITQGDAQAISERVIGATPYLLLAVQILLLLILLRTMRADGLTFRDLGWHLPEGRMLWQEVLIGVLVGVALGVLYIFVLSPLLATIQHVIGDYVPPGQLLPNLGSAVLPFFIANVLLAPFVEENIYRGYAIPRLSQRFSHLGAILISSIFFGLLHWSGGLWYIVLTGAIAGGVLAGLFTWRRNIVVAFTAHLALNLVEFLFVWLRY